MRILIGLFIEQIAEHQSCSKFSRILHSLFSFLVIFRRLRIEVFIYLASEKGFEAIVFINTQDIRFILGINDGCLVNHKCVYCH